MKLQNGRFVLDDNKFHLKHINTSIAQEKINK